MRPRTCLVNLADLDPPRNGGLRRVAHLVAGILADLHHSRQADVYFVVAVGVAKAFQDWLGQGELQIIPFDAEQGFTPLFEHLKPDVIISPLFGSFPFSKTAPFPGAQHLVSMPDALALERPDLFEAAEALRRRGMYEALRDATLVITGSQDARRRLLEHLGLPAEKIVAIPHAGDFHTGPIPRLEAPVRTPFVYYPANGWPHKRHELLVACMQLIWSTRPEVQLVLTGWKPDGYVEALCGHSGCQPGKIIDLGFIESSSQLAPLYRNAEALMFVSSYEGFGMPVLEAMHYGCPVVCAPLTSLPEVAGDAALYVDSEDPRDWARAFLEDLPPRRAQLIEKGRRQARQFSWEKTRGAWIALLSRFSIGSTSPASVARRPAALLSPAATSELLAWAGRNADLHAALRAKEQVIQSQLGAAAEKAGSDAQVHALLETEQQLIEKARLMRDLLAATQRLLEQERSLFALQLAAERAKNQGLLEEEKSQHALRLAAEQTQTQRLLGEEKSQHALRLAAEQAQKRDLEGALLEARSALAEHAGMPERLAAAEQGLVEKEQVIQGFRRSPSFWLANGPLRWFPFLRLVTDSIKRLRALFWPRPGMLSQHAPRPLRVPASYLRTAHGRPAARGLPSISLVTPSLNQGEFIGQTIQSVLSQAYPKLQYVVKDGGSVDSSLDVLDFYRSALSSLTSGQDGGQAHALNMGFARTDGEIMAYLNADDILLPGSLWYVGDYFRRHPEVDAVYGHRVIIDAEDQEIGRWVLPPHDNEVLSWADYVPQETLFWRRRLWEKSGAQLDETFQFAIDWELILRFRAAQARFRRLPRFLAAFRVHVHSKTAMHLDRAGLAEMQRLRSQIHGREIDAHEVRTRIRPYLSTSILFYTLYRLGVLRY